MLQKFKIKLYAYILLILGLTLITVSPVFAEDAKESTGWHLIEDSDHGFFVIVNAEDSEEFVACQKTKGAIATKICFKNLARKSGDREGRKKESRAVIPTLGLTCTPSSTNPGNISAHCQHSTPVIPTLTVRR